MLSNTLLCLGMVVSVCINVLESLGLVFDSLYKLNVDNLYAETLITLHHSVGSKCCLVDECYAYLWDKRLGHISKERMERLVKNEILLNFDFTDLNVCVDCIKGK